MNYRNFGRLDFEVSALGLGAMRLPVLEGQSGERALNLDEEHAIRMIRFAVDNGVNYIDTAYTYNQGKSEMVIGKALSQGYREKVKVATKLPVWLAKSHEDLYSMLDEQLERLGTEYIDMYLLHMLSHMTWGMVKELRVFEFLDRAKAQGKIKHVGFSFHDGLHLFKEIIEAYDWEFCYIQFNYLDENYQAGLEGIKYAHEKGLAVVVMEPLRGGSLVNNVPKEVLQIWNSADVKRSPAEWAFRWVCNHPQVSLVLSGMSSLQQLEENIKIFHYAEPNSVNEKELELISQVKEFYNKRIKVPCTQCGYCMPCPQGVFIRGMFNFYNNAYLFDKRDEALSFHERMKKMNTGSEACIECGNCERLCPQQLPIISYLKEAHAAFESKFQIL